MLVTSMSKVHTLDLRMQGPTSTGPEVRLLLYAMGAYPLRVSSLTLDGPQDSL